MKSEIDSEIIFKAMIIVLIVGILGCGLGFILYHIFEEKREYEKHELREQNYDGTRGVLCRNCFETIISEEVKPLRKPFYHPFLPHTWPRFRDKFK